MTPKAIRHGIAAAVLGGLLIASPAAATNEGGFSLDVLVDGRPLTEYAHQGASYVEAQPQAEYVLRLSNRSPRRVAVALAVDGLNTIDARSTTAAQARKWVLDPWQTVVIEGWQVSGSTARRFVFTTEASSYGAWLGRTENLGVIEAVVYPERRPLPLPRVQEQGKAAAGAPAAPSAARPGLRSQRGRGVRRDRDRRRGRPPCRPGTARPGFDTLGAGAPALRVPSRAGPSRGVAEMRR